MAKTTIPPYSPRWLSGIFRFLDSLPVPFWLIGVIYVIALAALRHWIAWEQGLLPQGEISSFLVVNPVYSLALIIGWLYLDRRAERALRAFFAGSGKKGSEINEAVSEFLSLSPIMVLVFFIFGAYIGYQGFLETIATDPLPAQILPVVTIVGFALSLGFISLYVYRLLHQIKMIRRLLASVEADIFNPQQVYALSSYGAAFAVTFFLAYILPSLPVTNLFASPGSLIVLYVIGLSLVVIFFIPLSTINGRMRANKDRLLGEIGNDLKQVQVAIHKAVSKKQFSNVDKMRGTLSALREERELILKIPTWPWQPETLRNLLTPLLIPVIVFLVQRYLGSFLGLQ